MPEETETPPEPWLARRGTTAQCLAVLALSAVFTVAVDAMHLPAALLIGPMLAGIVASTNGATVRISPHGFRGAQVIIGSLVATSISVDIVEVFRTDGLLLLAVVVATLAASMALGWLISWWRILPGTTGVWGSAPGGASAMVFMAQAFGADARLVAFMQYLRVIAVSLAAALIARLWIGTTGTAPDVEWFPPIDAVAIGSTLATGVAGAAAGRLLRVPSPYFLGATTAYMIMHLGFDMPIQLPHWLLAISYAVVGWSIGLSFTSQILAHAARALPLLLVSILALIAFCAGVAWLLVVQLGIDPLTAYLATSPGGLDSVAIIAAAAGSSVDLSFVMALQIARLLFILAFGPPIARLVARSVRE
jgi:membrane AbrB-like protein